MEIKRAAELVICSLLHEALTDLAFYPSRGGGNDLTPIWETAHLYYVGDIIRPTDTTMVYAIVCTHLGTSSTEPSWDDIPGSTYTGSGPHFKTTPEKSIKIVVDASAIKPPFGVVWINDGEKTISYEETSYLNGTVVWVTRADDTDIVTHSADFKRVYDALATIGSGYDYLRRLTVHGVDIHDTDEFSDGERQTHGDSIHFTMGVTEKVTQP